MAHTSDWLLLANQTEAATDTHMTHVYRRVVGSTSRVEESSPHGSVVFSVTGLMSWVAEILRHSSFPNWRLQVLPGPYSKDEAEMNLKPKIGCNNECAGGMAHNR
jgi:hypothetical protein